MFIEVGNMTIRLDAIVGIVNRGTSATLMLSTGKMVDCNKATADRLIELWSEQGPVHKPGRGL